MENREIDSLVAEKVMGMTLCVYEPAPPVTREMAMDAGDPSLEGSPSGPAREEWIEPPPFSTEISAAWAVVEKMRSLGFNFMVCGVKEGFSAGFTKDHRLSGSEGYQENAAKAICSAALQALTEREERS